jgi:hypothetical protein
MIRDSAVGYGLDCRRARVRVLIRAIFSPLHFVQTGSEAHSAPYATGTEGCFPDDKVAGG